MIPNWRKRQLQTIGLGDNVQDVDCGTAVRFLLCTQSSTNLNHRVRSRYRETRLPACDQVENDLSSRFETSVHSRFHQLQHAAVQETDCCDESALRKQAVAEQREAVSRTRRLSAPRKQSTRQVKEALQHDEAARMVIGSRHEPDQRRRQAEMLQRLLANAQDRHISLSRVEPRTASVVTEQSKER